MPLERHKHSHVGSCLPQSGYCVRVEQEPSQTASVGSHWLILQIISLTRMPYSAVQMYLGSWFLRHQFWNTQTVGIGLMLLEMGLLHIPHWWLYGCRQIAFSSGRTRHSLPCPLKCGTAVKFSWWRLKTFLKNWFD